MYHKSPLVICFLLGFSVIPASTSKTVYVSLKISDCKGVSPPCYQDLGEALEVVAYQNKSDGGRVFIFPGEYVLNRSVSFRFSQNIKIERYCQANSGEVRITCDENSAGLTFIHCADVTISGLSFESCGVPHNSTSNVRNRENVDNGYIQFNASMYFVFCSNVTLSGNRLYHSKGIAVQMYAVGGSINITANHFTDNPWPESTRGGGGLYIEFPFCSPFDFASCGTDEVTQNITVSNSSYFIIGNTFENNNASDVFSGSTFIFPNKRNNDVFGRGGGLSLFLKGNSSYNTFFIESNNFTNNTAHFGGGMITEYQDNCNHNKIIVRNCMFTSNHAKQAGGGVRLSMFSVDDDQLGPWIFPPNQF